MFLRKLLWVLLFSSFLTGCKLSFNHKKPTNSKGTTSFQTASPWDPETDVPADIAMIYGTHDVGNLLFEERVDSWRKRGFITHFMTGISWGSYQDYFDGSWDGKKHLDEGQVAQNGDTIWHHANVPYVIPTENYLKYLKEKHIKRAIDAGIDAIYMEEPEYWAHGGYSLAFKKEWKNYYGYEWKPQHESPNYTYLANKLKLHLYYRAIKEVFKFAKEYGKSKGINVKCYVPTHSLLSYTQIKIISPEASLASLSDVDGYIVQTWTGTARVPIYYKGEANEHVFESAFLEYGSMESMISPTNREIFFLTDPLEDNYRDWEDYKKNYQATFAAQLFFPSVTKYEVMPWPDRIYKGLYDNPESTKKEKIPRSYSTQMHIMINALNSMPYSNNNISGSEGISILMGNSMMLQRFPDHEQYEDPRMSNFYGLAMPLVKRGVPVRTVHLENLQNPESLHYTKILLMSYSNMKPTSPEEHHFIADWVRNGGVLIYAGQDIDPFQKVQEWWNTNGNNYKAASGHLFELMEIRSSPKEGRYFYGKGVVQIIRQDPKDFVLKPNGDEKIIDLIKYLYQNYSPQTTLHFKNNFSISRGPYDIISVMDESINKDHKIISGLFIDLFDPDLPVLSKKSIRPGDQAFLYNLERLNNEGEAQILAAAGKIEDEQINNNCFTFLARGPINTTNVMRIFLNTKPKKCLQTNKNNDSEIYWEWDEASNTCYLRFENHPGGVRIKIRGYLKFGYSK